jgi:uncharacterized protein YwgA
VSVVWLLRFLGFDRDELLRDENLRMRLKVQKAAYLLKYLNVSPFNRYDFNLYIHGPYSPELAREYYNLEIGNEIRAEDKMPEISNEHLELLRWFIDHDDRWLEIATSILIVREQYPELKYNDVYNILRSSKPWLTKEEYKKVYDELKSKTQLRIEGTQLLRLFRH